MLWFVKTHTLMALHKGKPEHPWAQYEQATTGLPELQTLQLSRQTCVLPNACLYKAVPDLYKDTSIFCKQQATTLLYSSGTCTQVVGMGNLSTCWLRLWTTAGGFKTPIQQQRGLKIQHHHARQPDYILPHLPKVLYNRSSWMPLYSTLEGSNVRKWPLAFSSIPLE